jgi:hypothetical protein
MEKIELEKVRANTEREAAEFYRQHKIVTLSKAPVFSTNRVDTVSKESFIEFSNNVNVK